MLDSHCKPDLNKRGDLQAAILEYKKIYGKSKPRVSALRIKHRWIYNRFNKNNLLEKYCKPKQCDNINLAIKEFKEIYGNTKPTRGEFSRDNSKLYYHFAKDDLLSEYCEPALKPHINIDKTIKEYLSTYGAMKITSTELREKNRRIWYQFSFHGLLEQYCKPKNQYYDEVALKEFKEIYGNKRAPRGELYEEHRTIYTNFWKNNLLDKYCYPNKSKKGARKNEEEVNCSNRTERLLK